MHINRVGIGLCWLVCLQACVNAATPPDSIARLPNPAVAKCLADGWRTESIMTNGAPTGTLCIEPKSGRQCEAWAYFRGECVGEGAASAPQNQPKSDSVPKLDP